MNKKLFLGMFVAAGMLFATSCSNDELEKVQSGNEAQVTFSLGLENGIGSRAISDGKSADKLVYAVFDAEGKRISTIEKVEKTGVKFPATENIRLAKGQTYQVAFWAQDNNCTAYAIDDNMNVTVSYAGLNNDESRDAFFKTETFTVNGDATINVELKRPFAQINVGVYQEDWDAAVASGVTIENSKVTIDNAATSLNLLTGEVKGEETVEYGMATIPTENLAVDLDKDGTKEEYVYLSMSYILANDKTTGYAKTTLQDLDFTFAPTSGNSIALNDVKFGEGEGLNAVPVQRNYRTNIIGYILTGNITFNISIDPIYDGEYNNGEALPVRIDEAYYSTIQEAVNAAKDDDVIKVATGTYTEVIDVTNGKTFTIEAAGPDVVIAGIYHKNNGAPTSTVTVKGITIDNSIVTKGWFIGTSANIYVCVGAGGGNLTFEDCKFIVDGSSQKETGVMTWSVTDKTELTFTNCTFEGGIGNPANARAMQIYGNVDLTVTGCTFNTQKDYTLKYVGKSGNVATLENNIVNNSEAFVEVGSSTYPGNAYTVNINNNTLGEGVNAYNIANQENQTVNESGNVSVIADGLIKAADGKYHASTSAGMEKALDLDEANITVILDADVTVELRQTTTFGGANSSGTITIDGGSKTLTFYHKNTENNEVTTANGTKLIIQNANITNSGNNSGTWNKHDLAFACEVELINVKSDKAIALENAATLTGVTINDANTEDTYALWIRPKGQTVTLDGCTIDMLACTDGRGIKIDEQYLQESEKGKVTLSVKDTSFKTEEKAAIIVKSTKGADITLTNVDITGVIADQVNAVWVDADAASYNNLVTVTGGTKYQEQ